MQNKGFTLLEMLVVIAITGLLASMVMINSGRSLDKTRDSRRIQEVYQIAHALQLYETSKGEFPISTDNDCSIHGINWDAGNHNLLPGDTFLNGLVTSGILAPLPLEWTSFQDPENCIYRYAKVDNPCDAQCSGTYAILYAACESDGCPVGERPLCCNGSSWAEGEGDNDEKDIIIFIKQKQE